MVDDQDFEDLKAKSLESNDEEEAIATQGNVRKTTLLNALEIASVNNFQEEEAKIIVILLIRSNDERKCEFLKTSNRINVLLSRVRHEMYIIGNTNIARLVPMWDKIIIMLKKKENIDNALALCCPQHKEIEIKMSKFDDFSISSFEDNYNRKCISRLRCEHVCINKCHSKSLHNVVRCLERCQRTKTSCDHSCPKLCEDSCDLKC